MLSYSLEGQSWAGTGVITYSFFGTGDASSGLYFSSGLGAAEQALADQALAAWASASGISFQQVAYSAQAPSDLVFGFDNYLDTDVYIDPDMPDSAGEFAPGQAVTLADPSVDPLITDNQGVLRYQLDGASFYQAVAAGIGSALGLYVSNDPSSVLYPVLTTANAGLGPSDIAGIQDLYGPPAGQAPALGDFNIVPGYSPAFFDISLSQDFADYVVFPDNYFTTYQPATYTYGATFMRSDGTSFSTQNAIEVMHFADKTVVLDDLGHAIEDVARLYEGAFGRLPDLPGLEFYADYLNTYPDNYAGELLLIAESAATSPEYLADYGETTNTQFVTQIYENAAGRAPDPGGLATYVGDLDAGVSRGAVLLAMSESQEAKAHSEPEIGDQDRSIVYRLNETILGQGPTASFLASEATLLDIGQINQLQIASSLLLSPQYAQLYGAPDNADFVTDLFENAYHQTPDAATIAPFVAQLDSGETRAALAFAFADSNEARAIFAPATNDGLVNILT